MRRGSKMPKIPKMPKIRGGGGCWMFTDDHLWTLARRSPCSSIPIGHQCRWERAYDSDLNARAFWRNVPANVWTYTLGRRQVMKKWLSYREFDVLGRSLTDTEAREVRGMARRIVAILLLGPKLGANYQAVQTAGHQWEGAKGARETALRLF
jgi:hypothetical protein